MTYPLFLQPDELDAYKRGLQVANLRGLISDEDYLRAIGPLDVEREYDDRLLALYFEGDRRPHVRYCLTVAERNRLGAIMAGALTAEQPSDAVSNGTPVWSGE